MIEVIVNRPSFEYDIHSLVKAFFPREDVQVRVQDTFTDETPVQMTDLSETFRLHRERASLGNPDRHPTDQDCHGTFRAGKTQCGNCGIYEKYLPGQQGKSGVKCYDCQPGTVCIEKYRL